MLSLNSRITPNELFFVRNHFDVPEIDAESWRLSIKGLVSKPYELALEQFWNELERRAYKYWHTKGLKQRKSYIIHETQQAAVPRP